MSLETRRVRVDLIEVLKFLNRGYIIDADFLNMIRVIGHSKKLFRKTK